MQTEKEYRLDLLNNKSVSVVCKEFIIVEGNRLQIGNTTRCCYSNTANDRVRLQEKLPAEYYNAVIAGWGDSPLFEDLGKPLIY